VLYRNGLMDAGLSASQSVFYLTSYMFCSLQRSHVTTTRQYRKAYTHAGGIIQY